MEEIERRIGAACARAGRPTADVSLLAVTKTVPPDRIAEAAVCGLRIFGESKVQEARQKIPLCPDHLEWHLVGHLQTNKVRDAVALFRVIHSIDSERLLLAVNAAAAAQGTTPRVFLEVNVSGERSKFGMRPEDVAGVLATATGLMNVEIAGLMTVPPFDAEPSAARPFFRRLREIRDAAAAASGFALRDLSMGMSNDLDVAIEEGATWVRVGSALFGKRHAAVPRTAVEEE